MTLLLSVIIPTYNRLPILQLTLAMYDQQEDFCGDFEVIVVDDGSTDETWRYLSEYSSSKFSFSAYQQENQGPARARNLALNHAQGQYLVITGDDIIPSKNFLLNHYQAHQSDPNTLAVLGRTVWHYDLSVNSVMNHIDGVGAQQFSYYYLANKSKLDFRHFYTSNISLLRSEIAKLDKFFDYDFCYAAYEDVELAYRIMGDSCGILYCENILGYHHHSYTLKAFSLRQYRAGQMACILKEKHPEIAHMIGFSKFKHACESIKKYNLPDESLAEWEVFLVDFFENYTNSRHHGWMDQVYIGIFEYFYMKGLVMGEYKERDTDPLLWYFLIYSISSALKEFEHIERKNIKNIQEHSKILQLIDTCNKSQPKTFKFSRYYNIIKAIILKIKSKLKRIKFI